MISRSDSGSMRSASAVELSRSEKTIVTVLRTSCARQRRDQRGAAETAEPEAIRVLFSAVGAGPHGSTLHVREPRDKRAGRIAGVPGRGLPAGRSAPFGCHRGHSEAEPRRDDRLRSLLSDRLRWRLSRSAEGGDMSCIRKPATDVDNTPPTIRPAASPAPSRRQSRSCSSGPHRTATGGGWPPPCRWPRPQGSRAEDRCDRDVRGSKGDGRPGHTSARRRRPSTSRSVIAWPCTVR